MQAVCHCNPHIIAYMRDKESQHHCRNSFMIRFSLHLKIVMSCDMFIAELHRQVGIRFVCLRLLSLSPIIYSVVAGGIQERISYCDLIVI